MRARTFWFLTLPALILAETAAHTLVARLDPEAARHHVLSNALEDFDTQRTGTLLPCIVAHGVFDAVQLFVIIPIAFQLTGLG